MTKRNKERMQRWKPAARKEVLLFIAGAMWIGVGIMLCSFAYGWLAVYTGGGVWLFALGGCAAAMVIHHFGFLRVVDKNLRRISIMEGKPCVFSFMSWKSYLNVAFMVGLGITLRHSPIPKQDLSILYIGIGGGLMLSSMRYMRVLAVQLLEQRKA